MQTSILAIMLVVVSSLTGAVGGLALKIASRKISLNFVKLLNNSALMFGLFLFGFSALIYIFALTQGNLNVLYPISSLGYVWSSLFAKTYLKEKINSYKVCGITAIVIGCILIAAR